jgi:hypothetical protein
MDKMHLLLAANKAFYPREKLSCDGDEVKQLGSIPLATIHTSFTAFHSGRPDLLDTKATGDIVFSLSREWARRQEHLLSQ